MNFLGSSEFGTCVCWTIYLHLPAGFGWAIERARERERAKANKFAHPCSVLNDVPWIHLRKLWLPFPDLRFANVLQSISCKVSWRVDGARTKPRTAVGENGWPARQSYGLKYVLIVRLDRAQIRSLFARSGSISKSFEGQAEELLG